MNGYAGPGYSGEAQAPAAIPYCDCGALNRGSENPGELDWVSLVSPGAGTSRRVKGEEWHTIVVGLNHGTYDGMRVRRGVQGTSTSAIHAGL